MSEMLIKDEGVVEDGDISTAKTEPLGEPLAEVPEQPVVEQTPIDPHTPGYWAERRTAIDRMVEGLHSRPYAELPPEDKDQLFLTLWNEFWPLFGLVEEHMLQPHAAPEAPKPAKKRTPKVPKAALPATESEAPDAA